MKVFQRGLFGLALFCTMVVPAQAQFRALNIGKLTDMFSKSKDLGEVSEVREIEIGSGIASNLLGAAPLVDNPAMQRYVNKVGMWLAMQTERPDLPWHFGVLETPTVNAFATPGGYVFITHGLLNRMHSEDELAGVLAHEISHVLKRHHLIAIQKAAKTGMMTDVLSIAASQHGSSENWSKVIGVGVGLYARGLDKNDEFEADRMGVVVAARAGYDPFGLPAVLLILDTVNAKDSSFALMFKTHPAPEARLQALETVMGADMDRFAGRMPPNKRFDTAVR